MSKSAAYKAIEGFNGVARKKVKDILNKTYIQRIG
jgi:hypothetical protein